MRITAKRPFGSDGWMRLSSRCGLAVGVLLLACADSRDQSDVSDDAVGVAVTVELESGHVVPGIFRGPRDEAQELSDGTFHFAEGVTAVLVMRPGSHWTILEGSEELRPPEMAVTVYREDRSLAPGSFFGPPQLAEHLSAALATERGVTPPAPTEALVLPEAHSRVRVRPLGTAVSSVDARRASN
jgi:hypothetical protein